MNTAKGAALLLVLWTLVLLSALMLSIVRTVQVESSQARRLLDRTQALACAEAGLILAINGLLNGSPSGWDVDGQPHTVSFSDATLNVIVESERAKVDFNNASPQILRRLLVSSHAAVGQAQQLATLQQQRQPPQFPMHSLETLLTLPGMDADLYQRLLPHLTLWSYMGAPDPAIASPALRKLLGIAAKNTVIAATNTALNIRSRATLSNRSTAEIQAVVQLTNSNGRPPAVSRFAVGRMKLGNVWLRSANDAFRAQWASSSLPGFLHWWKLQLIELMPPMLRAFLIPNTQVRLARWQGNALLDEAGMPWEENVQDERDCVLVIGLDQVLLRHLRLPVAAAGDLPAVLEFEIDKYMPLRSEQVYWASKRVDSGSATELELIWIVVMREHFDALMQQACGSARLFDSVDVATEDGGRLHVNLAPARYLRAKRSLRRNVNRGLTLLAVGLMLTAMFLWLDGRQSTLNNMTSQLVQLRQQVQEIETQNAKTLSQQQSGESLDTRKLHGLVMGAILNDLSSCIPQDTWLVQMEINAEGYVSFNGLSAQASELIKQLQACKHITSPQFQGPIQPDPATGSEAFTLTATLSETDNAHVQTP